MSMSSNFFEIEMQTTDFTKIRGLLQGLGVIVQCLRIYLEKHNFFNEKTFFAFSACDCILI